MGKNESTDSPLQNIDRMVHEPARFMILAYLSVVASADFLFLMRQTGLTRGNLSSHMSKLENAGYIKVVKDYIGRKPHTMLKITRTGRIAFESYREKMKQVLERLPEK